MKTNMKLKIWKEVLRKNITVLLILGAVCLLNYAMFFLYDIWMEPFVYSAVLSFILCMVLLVLGYVRERKRDRERNYLLSGILSQWQTLPEAHSLAEEEYQAMITVLGEELMQLSGKMDTQRQEMIDYYTTWVHQIKTPVAVIRLQLAEDTPEHHALAAELQRIEQYVEMALQYIRMESDSNDLVIREYSLDTLIRDSVRRQASQFISKKLRLCFTPTNRSIITDQKWFACIMDQLLSNAVKYTPAGTVTICLQGNLLQVSDTGIGIAPEDLPLIFDMGYTGINGRLGNKSTGLGLYLARKAANLLALPLNVESTVGVGTTFTLDLGRHLQ